MPYVLTVDQRDSRHQPDRVPEALRQLRELPVRRRFERTAGDEFQGVLDDPAAVVEAVLDLVRDGGWSIGIGAGAVEEPLPNSVRACRGDAFVLARTAVETAKKRPQGLAVAATERVAGQDAETVLTLTATLVQRRSPAAWKAIRLVSDGLTQTEAAEQLGISRQAVGQRLAAGFWHQVEHARPTAARLLARACDTAR